MSLYKGQVIDSDIAIHVCEEGQVTYSDIAVHVCEKGQVIYSDVAVHGFERGQVIYSDVAVHVKKVGYLHVRFNGKKTQTIETSYFNTISKQHYILVILDIFVCLLTKCFQKCTALLNYYIYSVFPVSVT